MPRLGDSDVMLLSKIARSLATSGGVASFNSRTGPVQMSQADVTAALGFTPKAPVTAAAYLDVTPQNRTPLTLTPTALDFVCQLPAAGTYAIRAQVKVHTQSAAVESSFTASAKLRRTNNTAQDVVRSGSSLRMEAAFSNLDYELVLPMREVIYTTPTANDRIEIMVNVDSAPLSGAMAISEASIVAVLIG